MATTTDPWIDDGERWQTRLRQDLHDWRAGGGVARLVSNMIWMAILIGAAVWAFHAGPDLNADGLWFAATVAFGFGLIFPALLALTGRISLVRLVAAFAFASIWLAIAPHLGHAWAELGRHGDAQTVVVTAGGVGVASFVICAGARRRRPTLSDSGLSSLGGAGVLGPDGRGVTSRDAQHEAVHAVVWAALGMHIDRVQLYPVGESRAKVSTICTQYGVDEMWATMIGSLAPALWDHEHGYADGGATSDVQAVTRTAGWLVAIGQRPRSVLGVYAGPMTVDGLLTGAAQVGREVMSEYRQQVMDLADEFVKAGSVLLVGDSLEKTLGAARVENPAVPDLSVDWAARAPVLPREEVMRANKKAIEELNAGQRENAGASGVEVDDV